MTKVSKRIKEFFTQNIGLKLVSLLLSVFLWMLVMNAVDPIVRDSVELNMTLTNMHKLAETNKQLKNESMLQGTKITVVVEGTASTVDRFKQSANNAMAVVDFAVAELVNAEQFNENLPTKVRVSESWEGITVLSAQPEYVNVQFDRIVTETMQITINRNGSEAEGYLAERPVLETETVDVTCSQTVMNTIDEVRANIDQTNASDDIQSEVELIVLDRNGNELTENVTLSTEAVGVSVVVNKVAEIPIRTPILTGTPAADSVARVQKVTPAAVTLVGKEAAFEGLTVIELPPISVEGVSAGFAPTFDLNKYLADNGYDLTVHYNSDSEVIVDVEVIQRATRSYTLPVSQVRISNSGNPEYIITIAQASFPVELKALPENLETLTQDDIGATVDLAGLEPGVHELPLTVDPIARVEILSTGLTATVNIELPPQPEETEPDGEVLGETGGGEETDEPTGEPTEEPSAEPSDEPDGDPDEGGGSGDDM